MSRLTAFGMANNQTKSCDYYNLLLTRRFLPALLLGALSSFSNAWLAFRSLAYVILASSSLQGTTQPPEDQNKSPTIRYLAGMHGYVQIYVNTNHVGKIPASFFTVCTYGWFSDGCCGAYTPVPPSICSSASTRRCGLSSFFAVR